MVQALAARFAQLEQEQSRVQSSLEEALAKEQENGRGLEVELTNERTESQRLRQEVEKLQTQLQKVSSEVSTYFMIFASGFCSSV